MFYSEFLFKSNDYFKIIKEFFVEWFGYNYFVKIKVKNYSLINISTFQGRQSEEDESGEENKEEESR